MHRNKNTLYIIVPCYNEQETIKNSAVALKKKLAILVRLEKISVNSKICFVDDGSQDNTWNMVCELNSFDEIFTGISLSKNRGHQNALIAGLFSSIKYADFTITIDADLQDDIDSIDEMVDKYISGYDIVYGVRANRETDGFFKKMTAEVFYKLLRVLGAKIIPNHADFRLMSKRAVKALEKFEEVNLFLRGIVPLIGFRSSIVYYKRKKRKFGKTKYSLPKMISFAADGLTSFSTKPIKLVLLMGLVSLILGIFIFSLNLFNFFIGTFTFSKSDCILISLWFIGGLILISLGIVAEYVGKAYLELKKRPRYFIEKNLDDFD